MPLKELIKPNTHLLKPLKLSFETFLRENIFHLGDQNKLRDACEYALLNGGKRIRPLIVLIIGKALGNQLDMNEASLCVEYFHTASLIADDLPCMDNDDYRRSKPALHKIYGESVALLASFALISAGYEKIFQSVRVLSKQKSPFRERANESCVVALDAATRCAGISGATGGQFKDLFPEKCTLNEVLDLIYKKTVTLFEISFILGWIFGGGSLTAVDQVKDAAYHFGLAFQIADDLGDVKEDGEGSMNIAVLLGVEKAFGMFQEEITTFGQKIKKLGIMTPEFEQIIDLLVYYAKTGSS